MNETLFDKLASNKKYSDVCPDTIRRVISECHGRYKKPKDMEKAVREKLHGVTSAFNELGGARDLQITDDAALTELLSRHASTRERLPLDAMDALYAQIFAVTGMPKRVLDLACGLNPIYLLHRFDFDVVGVDVSRSCVSMIDSNRHPASRGVWGDLLCENAIPRERFDIALLFKILPLLERQKSGSAAEVMRSIDAETLVVSFPTRTLGGRNVGMEHHYTAWMEAHLPANRSVAARLTTDNELYYVLKES